MVANRPVAAPDGLGRYALKVVVTLALVGAALALFRWVHVLMLAFGAVLVAVLLRALAAPIRRHTRLGEAWSVGAAVLAILLLIGGMIAFAGQQISAQLFQLQEYLPRAWSAAERGVMSLPGGPWVVSHVQQASNLSMGGLGPLAHRIGQFAGGSIQAAAEVIVVAVAGIYFAAQPRLYSDGVLGLLPPAARDRVAAASQDIAQALRRWLMGTGLAMLAMGVLVAIGASLLGLPAPLALGLISGLAEFVPVVGAAVAAVPALLLAAPKGPEMVGVTLLFYVAVHQLEAQVLIPLIQRRVVSVPPAMTIFAVLGFGVLLGPLGVIFATPLAVVLMVAVRHIYGPAPAPDQISPTADVAAIRGRQAPPGARPM